MDLKRVKKVYVLYGDQRKGKTSTLCMLIEKLIPQCGTNFMMQKKGSAKRIIAVPKKRNGCYQDVLFAGKIVLGGKTVLVGVATGGDDGDAVLKSFMFFDKCYPDYDFELVIVAVREQDRRDGLGDVARSFPLIRLEEIETTHNLNVMRPFLRTSVQASKNGSINATDKSAYQNVCRKANESTAEKIFSKLIGQLGKEEQ